MTEDPTGDNTHGLVWRPRQEFYVNDATPRPQVAELDGLRAIARFWEPVRPQGSTDE